jgi:hypothetical protein
MQPLQQAPAAHCPPGHGVPSATLLLSLHVAAPLAPDGQLVTPLLHGAPGFVVQLFPATQAIHEPPEQPLTHEVSMGL